MILSFLLMIFFLSIYFLLPTKVPRTRSSARHLTRFVSPRRSDGHDLLLLFLNGCVDVLDILVGQLLDLFFHGLLGVLGQLTGSLSQQN